MKLVVVIGAACDYELYEKNPVDSFPRTLSAKPLKGVFPALTCPAQAALRTASDVSTHGMPSNGFYDRKLCKPFFWEQSSHLYSGARIWEKMRERGGKVAQICVQQSIGPDSDVFLTPAPVHKHHGGMIQDFASRPRHLYGDLCKTLGAEFNLMNYWGPFTSVKSSEWIAGAACETIKRLSYEKDALVLTYLPNMDYDLQRYGRGPDGSGGPRVKKAWDQTCGLAGRIASAAKENGFEFAFVGDYSISNADTPVYPNKMLLESAFFDVRKIRGSERTYPVFPTSKAFALVDHQIAHVYVNDLSCMDDLKLMFGFSRGIASVTERALSPEMNHPNSGELILEAAEGCWFSYKWWNKPAEAPDYASHVDIHNKPGFDPCELFGGWTNLFRTPLDDRMIRGSHGRRDSGDVLLATSFAAPDAASYLDFANLLSAMLSEA